MAFMLIVRTKFKIDYNMRGEVVWTLARHYQMLLSEDDEWATPDFLGYPHCHWVDRAIDENGGVYQLMEHF